VIHSAGPLLIYGGSFDPVHNGHLAVFWRAAMELKASEARLLPCFLSPLKRQTHSTSQQRCQLLSLVVDALNARASTTIFSVDQRELAVNGPSFTCDTLADLRRVEGALRPIIWLLGMDAWQQLTLWRNWQQLTDFAHLLIALRPGFSPDINNEQLAWLQPRQRALPELAQSPCGGVGQLDNALLAISASRIRQQIAQGMRPVGLLPDAVEVQIHQQGLYLNSSQTDTL
jgi:nicotinate-nucleotide adenylyltransferase